MLEIVGGIIEGALMLGGALLVILLVGGLIGWMAEQIRGGGPI